MRMILNMKNSLFLLVMAMSLFGSSSALAGEGFFSRVYTTETVPEGHFELEQTLRSRSGRAYGEYNAVDSKSEFEYGVTDKFQAAFYLNTQYLHAKGAPDDSDPAGDTPAGFNSNGFNLQSISLELIYRVLSPISDPVGLAFYVENSYDFHDIHDALREYPGWETEFRIMLQKNFDDDKIIIAYNLGLEIEFFRYADQLELWNGEFDLNNELGVTYRVANNLYFGWEFRNHNEVGNFYTHDHSLIWTGPAIHYGGQKAWGTLGVLKQIWGAPNGLDDNGSFQGDSLFLHSHENWEITAKIGFPF